MVRSQAHLNHPLPELPCSANPSILPPPILKPRAAVESCVAPRIATFVSIDPPLAPGRASKLAHGLWLTTVGYFSKSNKFNDTLLTQWLADSPPARPNHSPAIIEAASEQHVLPSHTDKWGKGGGGSLLSPGCQEPYAVRGLH